MFWEGPIRGWAIDTKNIAEFLVCRSILEVLHTNTTFFFICFGYHSFNKSIENLVVEESI
jgi:hypothetical protein